MLKSSRKKLIAIGCSYTEDKYEFPVWPTHLADNLDMDCVNLGKSGSGNEQILAKILDTVLTEKNIGLVVVMWSQFQRFDFQISDSQWVSLNPDMHKTNIDWEMKYKDLRSLHNPHSATQNALRTFIYAENLLKDVPHLFIQGPSAFSFYSTTTLTTIDCGIGSAFFSHDFYKTNDSERTAAKSFLSSPYFDYIEDNISKYFVGWPIFTELGGYNVDYILDKVDPERNQLRISEEDTHPNGKGHKVITQEIYNAYAKIYT